MRSLGSLEVREDRARDVTRRPRAWGCMSDLGAAARGGARGPPSESSASHPEREPESRGAARGEVRARWRQIFLGLGNVASRSSNLKLARQTTPRGTAPDAPPSRAMEYVSLEGLRLDGRRPKETRADAMRDGRPPRRRRQRGIPRGQHARHVRGPRPARVRQSRRTRRRASDHQVRVQPGCVQHGRATPRAGRATGAPSSSRS